jgi:hypothetical protein
LYQDTTSTVSLLVQSIAGGRLALPDIQRPFVWQAGKVRALFDSMYRGFPVGYLLFWQTGADPGARQIGVDTPGVVPAQLIVDGQQRLTSLFAVMAGANVVREDYSTGRIRIAFRPADATFAVTDAAIEKDPEFIADISGLWQRGGKRATSRAYLARLAARRPVDDAEEERLEDAIDRLVDLQHYPFKVVELSADVDEEQVAEVFVRINSEGTTLNQADFILTLMSVFWEKGRRDLEEFCRACRVPSLSGASPFNWYLQPQPPLLLRATVAVGFRRAVLKHIYSLLRGRDVVTGQPSPQLRDAHMVDWNDNITISDQPPTEYWPQQLAAKQLPDTVLAQQVRWHALPEAWTTLPYEEFLTQRRRLMAQVVRTAFNHLADQQYTPVYPAPGRPPATSVVGRSHYGVRVADLLDTGLLTAGAVLINRTDDTEATVHPDGGIEFDGTAYDSPSGASDAAHGGSTNGWTYWLADTPDGLRPLAALRDDLLNDEGNDSKE